MNNTVTIKPENGRKTCVALGVFDGVHTGHRSIIEKAKALSEEKNLIPTVFTFKTKSVTTKSAQSLISSQDKLSKLYEYGAQLVFEEDFSQYKAMSPEEFVEKVLCKKLCCECVVCGYNFRFGKNAAGDKDTLKMLCDERGIKVYVVERVTLPSGEEISSSAIREHLKHGRVDKANELLGYPISILGEITHGNAIGRKMGYPTINQPLCDNAALFKFGVYCSETEIGGRRYKSLTNIGVKPTVDYKGEPVSETHILDFDLNAYGDKARVYLLKFLREEIKFSSKKELAEQIARDIASVKTNE